MRFFELFTATCTNKVYFPYTVPQNISTAAQHKAELMCFFHKHNSGNFVLGKEDMGLRNEKHD